MRKKTYLPQEFKKYFWDIDFDKIASRPPSNFVLERIMNFGNFRALRWLLHSVPKRTLRKVASTSRELDPKTKNFWQIVYGK